MHCRQDDVWQAELTLDAVISESGRGASLRSLLAMGWPSACPAAAGSIGVLASAPGGPSQASIQLHADTDAAQAGLEWLMYDLQSHEQQQQQPIWQLASSGPSPQAPHLGIQQYVGGSQGIAGVYTIHVRQLSRQATEQQAYCLLHSVPWQMQLQLAGLTMELHHAVRPCRKLVVPQLLSGTKSGVLCRAGW